jgi:4-hydroxy-L-threonine phosphate dehydrogenase PdxA
LSKSRSDARDVAPVLAVTPGEPDGIGHDLLVTLAQQGFDAA